MTVILLNSGKGCPGHWELVNGTIYQCLVGSANDNDVGLGPLIATCLVIVAITVFVICVAMYACESCADERTQARGLL